MVTDALLEFFNIGKAAHLFTGPDALFVEADFENAAGPWFKCNGIDRVFKGHQ